MKFSEKGESSQKRKHQGSDIIYKKRTMLNEGMNDLKEINAKIRKRVKHEKEKKMQYLKITKKQPLIQHPEKTV